MVLIAALIASVWLDNILEQGLFQLGMDGFTVREILNASARVDAHLDNGVGRQPQ